MNVMWYVWDTINKHKICLSLINHVPVTNIYVIMLYFEILSKQKVPISLVSTSLCKLFFVSFQVAALAGEEFWV